MNAHVLAITLAASTSKTPPAHVTDSSKALAIVIGVGVLILLYVVVGLIGHAWNPKKLVNGFDGFASTSKLQWFLWLIVILFGYAAIWAERALQGNYMTLSDIPVNLLTVLGFSTGTAAAAKGITSAYVQSGKMTKPGAPSNEPGKNTGGIFQDDGGAPELAKIQMIGFTIIAIGIFVATVVHQIVSAKTAANLTVSLPDIDPSLMVLMGISQGGYLGKKLVTFGTPSLYPLSPNTGIPGTSVTLRGANLGSPSDTQSQLLLNGRPLDATWSATSVQFTVPVDDPATGVPWTGLPKPVQIVVSSGGQPGNTVEFTIAMPRLAAASPQTALPGASVTLTGTNLGAQPGNQLRLGTAPVDASNWSATSIQFTVPVNDPATANPWTGLPRQVPVSVSVASQVSTLNVTIVRPTLTGTPTPSTGPPGTSVTLAGTNLGAQPPAQLMLGDTPIDTITGWSVSSITFTVPGRDPRNNNAVWAAQAQVPLAVSVAGQTSNTVQFTVTAPLT
jgi:hypothetical protein